LFHCNIRRVYPNSPFIDSLAADKQLAAILTVYKRLVVTHKDRLGTSSYYLVVHLLFFLVNKSNYGTKKKSLTKVHRFQRNPRRQTCEKDPTDHAWNDEQEDG